MGLVADAQNIGQQAGVDGAVAYGRADLQAVGARLQVGRHQEHQLRGVIFPDHVDLGSAAVYKKDTLVRISRVELEPVAGQPAHAAGGHQDKHSFHSSIAPSGIFSASLDHHLP